jgi:hypothetical protein
MPQQINLIDASLLPQRQRLRAATVLAVAGTGMALVLGHFAWERLALARALAALAQGEGEVQATAGEVGAGSAADQALQLARGEALRELLSRQPSVPAGSAQLMGQIVQSLPDTLWLTELELGAARAVRISGGTTDAAGFGQFTTRLGGIAALQGVPIGTVRLEPHATAATPGAAGSDAPAQLFVLASAADAAAVPRAGGGVPPKASP